MHRFGSARQQTATLPLPFSPASFSHVKLEACPHHRAPQTQKFKSLSHLYSHLHRHTHRTHTHIAHAPPISLLSAISPFSDALSDSRAFWRLYALEPSPVPPLPCPTCLTSQNTPPSLSGSPRPISVAGRKTSRPSPQELVPPSFSSPLLVRLPLRAGTHCHPADIPNYTLDLNSTLFNTLFISPPPVSIFFFSRLTLPSPSAPRRYGTLIRPQQPLPRVATFRQRKLDCLPPNLAAPDRKKQSYLAFGCFGRFFLCYLPTRGYQQETPRFRQTRCETAHDTADSTPPHSFASIPQTALQWLGQQKMTRVVVP